MKSVLSGFVMAAMMATTMPVAAAAKAASESTVVAPIAGAVKDAGQKVTPRVETARASASTKVPVALPRSGGRVRKSATMMITTLVSTAAGAAASIYMVKQMQKNSEQK